MTGSDVLAKCVVHAIHIMQFVDGKENFFALGKIILFSMFLGVT